MKYSIVRMYRDDSNLNHIVKRGLTLDEAQEHCRDKETSSSTCTGKYQRAITDKHGAWFDGYQEQ